MTSVASVATPATTNHTAAQLVAVLFMRPASSVGWS